MDSYLTFFSMDMMVELLIAEATKMFQSLDNENKAFTLIHCWNILKDEDKWKAKRLELVELEKQPNKKKQKSTKMSRPRDDEATNNEEVPEDGIKKAKEALRRGGGKACMEALDNMWAKKEAFDKEIEKAKEERFNIALELEKKRVSAEEKKAEAKLIKVSAEDKKAEAELIKEEKEIMSIDMTSLSPLQRQYYETMQEKIVVRRLAN
ncbi:hypothetical protein ZEAMMB73_Zm00001d016296 [Zea mays]|uniref:No apical meristem-associated C-terminal domain-containing protein n=2 Tax=Zea mays TaxID=4577 RepID=A0A1D6H6L9_MAIZE|nr:hypothetical protein ZEAMMB73_Zm00001d016296 [Zea mays]